MPTQRGPQLASLIISGDYESLVKIFKISPTAVPVFATRLLHAIRVHGGDPGAEAARRQDKHESRVLGQVLARVTLAQISGMSKDKIVTK